MRSDTRTILDGYTASTDAYSAPLDLLHLEGFSISAVFVGGSPAGTITLHASNDYVRTPLSESAFAPSNWAEVSGASSTVAAAGTVIWNCSNVYWRWVRVFYDRSSGTSTLTITATGKGSQ